MVQYRLAKEYCFQNDNCQMGIVFRIYMAEDNCVQHQSYHHTENSNKLSWIIAEAEINVI